MLYRGLFYGYKEIGSTSSRDKSGRCVLELGRIDQDDVTMARSNREAARYGITFGTALAIAISWSVNESVLWAILHGLLSWFYVIWHVVTR